VTRIGVHEGVSGRDQTNGGTAMLIVIRKRGRGTGKAPSPPRTRWRRPPPRPRRDVWTTLPFRRDEGRARARRVLNVVVAAVLLVGVAPLMLLIALAVRLSSPGPILFVQVRVGLDSRGRRVPAAFAHRRTRDHGGRLFRMYKFRTMVAAKDLKNRPQWASANDSRITSVGRILRKTRLDELPQLVNVLKGDMNIVGPRPEQPEIFRKLRQEIPEYPERQRVLPGITGWAQVNRHYDRCIADVRRKVALDLEYIDRQSALEDFRIMLRTFPVMFFHKGAV